MREDDSGGVRVQSRLHDFARIDCSAVDGAAEQHGAFQYSIAISGIVRLMSGVGWWPEPLKLNY